MLNSNSRKNINLLVINRDSKEKNGNYLLLILFGKLMLWLILYTNAFGIENGLNVDASNKKWKTRIEKPTFLHS